MSMFRHASRGTAWKLALATGVACVCAAARGSDSSGELQDLERLTPDPARGAVLYRACAECHAREGSGGGSSAVPQIAGQHVRVIEKQLVDYRHRDRWDVRMEAIASRHVLASLQAIADVAAYAAARPPLPSSVGDGSALEMGRQLYEARCVTCHGRAGEGSDAQRVPRLAGQRFEYLLRQLQESRKGGRANMPPLHRGALVRLDDGDLAGLADYLARLPAPASENTATRGHEP